MRTKSAHLFQFVNIPNFNELVMRSGGQFVSASWTELQRLDGVRMPLGKTAFTLSNLAKGSIEFYNQISIIIVNLCFLKSVCLRASGW